MVSHLRVKPAGPLDAKIALIGEAPGVDEEVEGKPFVGASGRELNALLSSAGISRSSIYIDNVIPVRPSRNDITEYITLRHGKKYIKTPVRTPEYDQYEAELKERLSKTSANVFIAMGNTALYALTRVHPGFPEKRRGSILPCTLVPGRKVIPTIHTSTVVRGNYLNKLLITKDLIRAREESEYPEMRLPTPELIIRPSFEQALDFLNSCLTKNFIAWDIEGTHFVNCISFARTGNSAISIPFVDERGQHYFNEYEELAIWRKIAEILERPDIVKCGQNLNYDMKAVYRLYGIITHPIEDTMCAMNILYPDYPKALDFITRWYTRYPYYKDEGAEYIKTGIGNMDEFWKYSAMDSIIPYLAFPQMVKDLKRQGNWDTYKRQRDCIYAIQYMQARGIRLDIEGLKKRRKAVELEIELLISEFKEKAGEVWVTRTVKGKKTPVLVKQVSPTSPQQMDAYFYGKLKLKEIKEKGKRTTGKRALQKWASKGIEEAKILMRIRALSTLNNNYLKLRNEKTGDFLLDPKDSRLRCSFNAAGTITGRWTSSKWFPRGTHNNFGRNLQNLPKLAELDSPAPFRSFLIADEGYFFVRVDLSMAELRITSYIAPEPHRIALIESGSDIHKHTGAYVKEKELSECTSADRDTGKRCNFGFDYGMGPIKFSMEHQIPLPLARKYHKRHFQLYPGLKRYHHWVPQKLYKDRTLINVMGRVRKYKDHVGRITSGEVEEYKIENVFSWIPSSTVADIINERGVNFIYADQKIFFPVELLLQIHDEIDFQVPISMSIEQLFDMLTQLKNELEKPLHWKQYTFRIPANFELGFNLWNLHEVEEWSIEGLQKTMEDLKNAIK